MFVSYPYSYLDERVLKKLIQILIVLAWNSVHKCFKECVLPNSGADYLSTLSIPTVNTEAVLCMRSVDKKLIW